jgi:pyruvate/2-oxoglutarate dehydrogenase complex dihydrolipoamide dehydrogenase (E3) component
VPGGAQFTHVSADDYRVIADNLAGRTRHADQLVPYCMFTDRHSPTLD